MATARTDRTAELGRVNVPDHSPQTTHRVVFKLRVRENRTRQSVNDEPVSSGNSRSTPPPWMCPPCARTMHNDTTMNTKKQIETANKYKRMGWHEREADARYIYLEKGEGRAVSRLRIQKDGTAKREVAHV